MMPELSELSGVISIIIGLVLFCIFIFITYRQKSLQNQCVEKEKLES